MEDIQEKRAAAAAYETADEQAVAGFVSSLKRKHTLNGLQCGKHHIAYIFTAVLVVV